VRPTLYEWGKAEDALSREHEILDHARHGAAGLYSMIGGKLASYRMFAEEMTDRICTRLDARVRCSTHLEKLPGGEEQVAAESVAEQAGIDVLSARRLVYRHGSRARQLAEQMQLKPKSREVVCPCEPVRRVEIEHAVEHEWAFDVDSVARRTRLGLGSCGGIRCAARCGALVAQLTERSPEAGRQMAYDFLRRAERQRASIVRGPQAKLECVARQVRLSLGSSRRPSEEGEP
jgi:glycerol-3-phosphate dehydrogenase